MNGTFKAITILFICSGFATIAQEDVFDFPMSESSLLWEIQGDSIPDGSYLFGTMHIMDAESYFFPDTLNAIIRNSDVLITEIDESLFDPSLMSLIMLEEGSFFDFFTEEQVDSLTDWGLEHLNMDEEMFRMSFDKMKPFVVAQLITMLEKANDTRSHELEFQQLANEVEIKIEGLESAEEQFAMFDNLSRTEQAEMVMSGIRDNTHLEDTEQLQILYRGQHVDSLYMAIGAEESIIMNNEDIFITNRNKNWIPKIEEVIRSQKCFIAVGAGHLGGPNGIIRLLQKEGYRLIPVAL